MEAAHHSSPYHLRLEFPSDEFSDVLEGREPTRDRERKVPAPQVPSRRIARLLRTAVRCLAAQARPAKSALSTRPALSATLASSSRRVAYTPARRERAKRDGSTPPCLLFPVA
ncbi:hypothetical protein MRX96_007078 [Rhipicephalus microplus]